MSGSTANIIHCHKPFPLLQTFHKPPFFGKKPGIPVYFSYFLCLRVILAVGQYRSTPSCCGAPSPLWLSQGPRAETWHHIPGTGESSGNLLINLATFWLGLGLTPSYKMTPVGSKQKLLIFYLFYSRSSFISRTPSLEQKHTLPMPCQYVNHLGKNECLMVGRMHRGFHTNGWRQQTQTLTVKSPISTKDHTLGSWFGQESDHD